MSLFKKIFGKKETPATPPPAAPVPPTPSAPPAPAASPNTPPPPEMIRVLDAYGREVQISRQDWAEKILPGNIQNAWSQPDALYQIILGALNDNFRAAIVPAAQHLYEIDPDPIRGTCVWGIVLMEEGRIEEAGQIFTQHLARHGESGVVLTNYAKVLARQGDQIKAEATLWHALELDPNQENAFGWYAGLQRERGGPAAEQAAQLRVAQLPGSWRAQLWQARHALHQRDLTGALALYREALSRMNPPPGDALTQISGDLGNAGHLTEIINLIAPLFEPARHGLELGNNLIKAHVDLGQLDAARAILDQLYALERPDWKPHLAYWDHTIAQAHISTVPQVSQEELKVTMLNIEGPIWLRPNSPAAELFTTHPQELLHIAFLGSSAEAAEDPARIEQQLSDARGRLSRSLPLFLAEKFTFLSNTRAYSLVPWILNNQGGFVLAGSAWSAEQAAAFARSAEPARDYLICTHLQTSGSPWTIQLRLIRTIDGACLHSAEMPLSPDDPTEGFLAAYRHALQFLQKETDLVTLPSPANYEIPAGDGFAHYLLRLEQLLAVRCEANKPPGQASGFLSGEREILDGNLQQCLAFPASVPVRVLMAQTFASMRIARPAVLPEFKQRVALLQRDNPLPEPAQSVIQRLLHEAFS